MVNNNPNLEQIRMYLQEYDYKPYYPRDTNKIKEKLLKKQLNCSDYDLVEKQLNEKGIEHYHNEILKNPTPKEKEYLDQLPIVSPYSKEFRDLIPVLSYLKHKGIIDYFDIQSEIEIRRIE